MIRDILLLQKREIGKRFKERYLKRNINSKKINNDLIKVIIGPRRAGKSFFAIHMLKDLGSFGYVNFDDEKLIDLEDYQKLIDIVNSIYKNPKYLLFDEVQNLKKWELFVNRLKRQGFNLFITGSNSHLLSQELASHLTGRHTSINLFPFSFKEVIKYGGNGLTENEIKEKLRTYLIFGGYPEPLIKHMDYKDYLLTLFNSIIYKDIVKRHKIRSVQGIDDLTTYLVSNVSNEFSYNALSKISKCKSVHTVEKYLNYLEEAFILFKLNRFSYKLKEQTSSNKKIYCIDNGLVYAKGFKLSPDLGKLYENLVAIELKKLEMGGKINFYYWKNSQQEEVDFVIKKDLKVNELIQVCYNLDNDKTKKREIRALLKASKELKCKNLILITEDKEEKKEIEWFGIKREIKFIPLWKWLLNNH